MMKQYKGIHFWENKRRIVLLESFRTVLVQYYEEKKELNTMEKQGYSPEANPVISGKNGAVEEFEKEELRAIRKEINKISHEIEKIVISAGLSVHFTSELTHQKRGINVFENIFKLELIPISYVEMIDLIDKAIGIYEFDQRNALMRTMNPFFWLNQSIVSLTRLPFLMLNTFGFKGNKIEESSFGESIKGLIKLIIILIIIGLALEMMNLLDNVISLVVNIVTSLKNTFDSAIVNMAE